MEEMSRGWHPTINGVGVDPFYSVSFISEVRWTQVRYSQSRLSKYRWPIHQKVQNVKPISFLIYNVIVFV
jgi:hypothetical protein